MAGNAVQSGVPTHRSSLLVYEKQQKTTKKNKRRIVVQIARVRVNTEGRRLFWPHGAKPLYSSSFSPPPPLSQAGAVYGEDANVDVAGYVSDVQCTRKRTESKDFRTPDNGVDPLKDLTEHTRKCLYDIVSCRDSGYDILADRGLEDPDGGGVIYYAEYRLGCWLEQPDGSVAEGFNDGALASVRPLQVPPKHRLMTLTAGQGLCFPAALLLNRRTAEPPQAASAKTTLPMPGLEH